MLPSRRLLLTDQLEELHIPRRSVRDRFDDVERKLLQDFYAFVRDRRDKYWIHWNMRNLTFGFEHLERRYRVLGGNRRAYYSGREATN